VIRARREAERERVVVEVEDNGRGFDPAHAGRIFDPFTRLDPRAGPEGSGMGLAIVRSVALRHGGDVSVTARPGEGALFRLVLPCAPRA
jgi:hypothetical protein